MKFVVKIILLLNICNVFSQPINNKCSSASEISISESNFGIGNFNSLKSDLEFATRESGEIFHQSIAEIGNNDKSVWYKFTIPTTRNVEIILKQEDSMIPQIFVGLAVYKSTDCNINFGKIADGLTPIVKFGSTGNACLHAGTYFIQVCAKQRAKGEIWIDLVVKKPVNPSYDNFLTPYDFGLIVNQAKSFDFDVQCLTTELHEQTNINNSDFNKSFWIKVKFNNQSTLDNFQVYTNNNFMYRIFKNVPNIDSVNSIKPYITSNSQNIFQSVLYNFNCNGLKYNEMYVQIILNSNTRYFQVTCKSQNKLLDNWNTSNTNFKISTNNTFNNTSTRNINCESLLSNHLCKDIIPNHYIINNQHSLKKDTLKNANYIVVNSSSIGIFKIKLEELNSYNYPAKFVVFEGDISNGCNLIPHIESQSMTSEFNFCVEAKTYTIVIVHIFYLNQIKVKISQTAYSNNINHFRYDNVHEMGNFIPGTTLYSKTLNSNQIDTTVEIKNFKKTGRFVFQDLYLSSLSTLIIDFPIACSRFKYFIFKGRFQNNTIDTIMGVNYENGGYENCKLFKAGYYTLISYFDTNGYSTTTPCQYPNSCFTISSVLVCPNQSMVNNQPNKAIKIDNNMDLLSNTANKIGTNFIYDIPICTDCYSFSTSQFPLLNCKNKQFLIINKYVPLYFTFYIGQNTEIQLMNNSFLYKGDVTVNPHLCLDSNNLIDQCSYGNIYCNLEGDKFYTIVYWAQSRWSPNYKLIVTPHKVSINDHAKNAFDFGHILNTNKTSPPIPITCHTSAAFSDPKLRDYIEYETYLIHRTSYPIPYKDTQNKLRVLERRNLWYTFTTSGAGNISIIMNSINSCKAKLIVYRSKQPYNFLFDYNFDSTKNGLDLIASNRYSSNSLCFENNLVFQNISCNENRYFVLIENQDAINSEFTLKITQNPTSFSSNIGNLCSNVISKTVSTFGSHIIQGYNNCHNYGGSPFEEIDVKEIKSTWFEFKINSIPKFDFEIKYTGSAPLMNYNIYGGDCNNMIKIASLSDAYAFVSLSCMSKGSIYIQAICENTKNGLLSFNATIKTPLQVNCKPFDFRQPIAQFDLKGGCTDDSLISINKSNQGNFLSYFWYVNNQFYSNEKKPKFNINHPSFSKDNFIKLIVINNSENLKDSMVKFYQKRDFDYVFKIKSVPPFNCYDTLLLETSTSFQEKLNYEWYGFNFSNRYLETQKIFGQSHYKISVIANNENCEFKDSFELSNKKPDIFFTDSVLCNGSEINVNTEKYDYVAINNQRVFNNFKITKTGIYHISFTYKGCSYYEKLNATVSLIKDTVYFFDTLRICNSNFIELKSETELQSYKWSTGDSTHTIQINLPNNYQMNGNVNECRTLVQNFNTLKDSVPVDFLRDTIVCVNELFYFKATNNKFPIFVKTPAIDSFVVLKDTKINIILGYPHCNFNDTALVKVIHSDNISKDTQVCFNENFQTYLLDAGTALSYDWLGLNNYSQFLSVNLYNIYQSARINNNNCKDTVSFKVTEKCPLNVFYPNAFSPNDDISNNVFKVSIHGEYESYEYLIFNRWGEIIFKAKNEESWNGFYKSERVQEGVYGILIKVYAKSGDLIFRNTLTVLY